MGAKYALMPFFIIKNKIHPIFVTYRAIKLHKISMNEKKIEVLKLIVLKLSIINSHIIYK